MLRSLFVVAVFTALACCQAPPRVEPVASYDDLVARHNDRVRNIERFWARAVIEMRWVDENGRSQFQQGDGNIVLDLPLHSALTLGKLGQERLWAGSNETYYWLFDNLDGNEMKLYLGRHDGQSDPQFSGGTSRSPLPIRPVDLPRLLAILPIENAAGDKAVERIDDTYVIAPAGQRARYYFHPIYSRVVRVDLLDPAGKTTITARLGKPEAIVDEHGRRGAFLNTFIEVVVPGQDGRMTLYLSDMTDDPSKVRARAFDLEVLKNIKKPDRIIPIRAN